METPAPELADTPVEQVAPAAPASTTRAAVETLVGTTIWTILWALILNSLLQLLHTHGDVKYLVLFNFYHQFGVFALGALVTWVVVLLVLALVGRLWLTCAITLDIVIAIGIIDQTKLKVRREPVYPSDFDFLRSPGFLFEMVSPAKVVLAVLVLLAIGTAVVLLGRIPTRTFKPIRRQEMPRAWRGVLVSRVATGLLCVLALHYAAGFNTEDNKLREAFEGAGAEWAFWYQDLNYKKNGVVPGLLYNLLADPMEQPAGYSRATMDQIASRWTAEADAINADRVNSIQDVNVVSILSEAFSDPTRLKGMKLDGDPIPFTRSLMTRTTSGTMLAQLYGGGTANMEFEALTGQSLSQFEPQVNTPYQQFVQHQTTYPSIVGYLRGLAHDAIAIHPYITSMYQRTKVYKTLGIEKFIHDTTMHEQSKIDDNDFISDAAAYDEVVRQIDGSTKPLLINLITMQNHWPMMNKYKDPWPVTGVKGDTKKQVGGYSRGINHSDQAMAAFLDKLSASPEKTAVIFYGDHLPGIYPRSITQQQDSDLDMKETPFFIWTNFPTKKLDTAALTSPIYFQPLLFEQLGVKIPPYYALLSELYQHVPAMEQDVRLDWKGDELSPDPETEQLLHDYRLVQYDLSVGRRYSQSALFYPAE